MTDRYDENDSGQDDGNDWLLICTVLGGSIAVAVALFLAWIW